MPYRIGDHSFDASGLDVIQSVPWSRDGSTLFIVSGGLRVLPLIADDPAVKSDRVIDASLRSAAAALDLHQPLATASAFAGDLKAFSEFYRASDYDDFRGLTYPAAELLLIVVDSLTG